MMAAAHLASPSPDCMQSKPQTPTRVLRGVDRGIHRAMQGARWLVILVVLLGGCTGTSTPRAPEPTAPEGTSTSTSTTTIGTSTSMATTSTKVEVSSELRMGTSIPIDSLDPADALTFGDWEILFAVNEGLLRREPGNGDLLPGIAEDLPEVSEDGLTYTFALKSGVQFADGTELTAPMYVDGINRVMRLGGRSSELVSLYVSSVEAPDDITVVFHLHDAFAFFPELVASVPYVPTHPDAYPLDELVPLPDTPVPGVGPWSLARYTESEIVLESNPNYHGGVVTPGRIVIRVFGTADEMTNALVGGHVDLLWRGVGSESAATLAEIEGLNVETVPNGTLHFFTVNHQLTPTDDPSVRQALAELVDRQAISEQVLGGAFVPALSPVPPGFVGSSDSFSQTYGEPDLTQAIDLLTEAGYSESNRAEIELAYPPERFGLHVAPAMEEVELQMEATGLIEVTLTAQPWNTYVGDVIGGTYNLAYLGWLHDFPDTHNYLAPFVLDGGIGGSGDNLEHPEIITLVTEAATTFDEQERVDLYVEAQKLFAEDVVTIPLWVEHPYIAYGDQVEASEEYDNPQSLNIGSAVLLDFRSLGRQGDG
jgi:peptide/nickel transport system substrate-binding protein